MGRRLAGWAAVVLAGGCVLVPPAGAAVCANAGAVDVPGAERQTRACLDDMTTAGTRATTYTDVSDWASLAPSAQRNPSGRARPAGRRLLPGHLDHQHHPRLAPRRAVRDPPARPVEREARDHRRARRRDKQYAIDPVIATGCSPAATPTRRPTRATAGTRSTRDGGAARRRDRRVAPARHRARGGREAGGTRSSTGARRTART